MTSMKSNMKLIWFTDLNAIEAHDCCVVSMGNIKKCIYDYQDYNIVKGIEVKNVSI